MIADLDWLSTTQRQLEDQIDADRLSHALLVAGPQGTGKQALVEWLATRILRQPHTGSLARLVETIPDLVVVAPEEKKASISVNQVRALGEGLTLSSHGNAGKVAIVAPAEAMTIAAANALLKTLEEPVPNRWIILVSHDPSRLPATVLSRCERVIVNLPPAAIAQRWLVDRGLDAQTADDALGWTDGAPLRALALAESGKLETLEKLESGLAQVLAGRISPLAVSETLAELEFAELLAGLRKTAIAIVRAQNGLEMRAKSDFSNYVIDLRGLFCYLDTLNRLTVQSAGSFNPELTLENLLLPWGDGFASAA